MVGIEAFGAYVPLHRLSFEEIGKAWSAPFAKGERSVAAEDEDSLTMAVGAAQECLKVADRGLVDGVLFASTCSPFFEKQAATTIAAAVDLQAEISTADFGGSLRSGSAALNAAINSIAAKNSKKVLVSIADCRLGQPGTPSESALGDGAAAFVIGDSNPAIGWLGSYSVADEITDCWRRADDKFVHSWEERFAVSEGALRVVPQAVAGALRKLERSTKDIATFVSNAPNERAYWDIAKKCGFDLTKQVPSPLYSATGHTGAASGPLHLISCLERTNPGDLILWANYGNGCDVLLFEVLSDPTNAKSSGGLAAQLASRKPLRNYNQYAQWRGLLPAKSDRMPPVRPPSTVLWRDQESLLRFHAAKCTGCGHVQYPIHRVCSKCVKTDSYDKIRLSDQTAVAFSSTVDNLGYGGGTAPFWAIADFPEVRVRIQIADAELTEVKTGDTLEMTFRKLPSDHDVPVYGWKARRPR